MVSNLTKTGLRVKRKLAKGVEPLRFIHLTAQLNDFIVGSQLSRISVLVVAATSPVF